MPVVGRYNGYRIHFFANEGSPREPVHVHVKRDGPAAKFWLRPFVRLDYNDGIGARDLRELTLVIQRDRDRLERAWNEFFGS